MNLKLTAIFVVLAAFTALQSFQCATPGMTAGREAYRTKNFDKSSSTMQQELQKNEDNAEAWFILGSSKRQLKEYEAAIEALNTGEKKSQEKVEILKNIRQEQYLLWVDLYNDAAAEINAIQSKKNLSIEKLKNYAELCLKVKPENYSILAWVGVAAETVGDTSTAIVYFEKYIAAESEHVQIGTKAGLNLEQNRTEIIAKLGTPKKSTATKEALDSAYCDEFDYKGTNIRVFSIRRKNGASIASGWRTNLPEKWLPEEKERYFAYFLEPYYRLIDIYNRRKEYTTALEYLDKAAMLTPSNGDLSAIKLQIYENEGRTEEILKSLADMMKNNPGNKIHIVQYATALSKANRLDEAITYYEKALALDPDYDLALYNLGAEYKNKASKIQRQEREKRDRNPKYRENEELYKPLLVRAADLFSKYKNLASHRGDLVVLQQLSNIYEVMLEKTKFKAILSELEALEPENRENVQYWNMMGAIYIRQPGMREKADNAFRMEDKLKTKQ